MILFIWLAAIKSIFLGSIWGRVDGGGIATVHEWVERTLIMFFPVVACAPFANLWALFAYAGVVGIATGHGQYFLSRAIKYIGEKLNGDRGTYERTSFLLNPFFGKDPRTDTRFQTLSGAAQTSSIKLAMEQYGMDRLYWRNVCGMFITGLLFGLPAAILAIVFGEYLSASLFLCTGFAKSIAYMIGYKFFPDSDTEAGEYINGGLRTAICVFVIITII